MLRPSRRTLFPYTTLFRSGEQRDAGGRLQRGPDVLPRRRPGLVREAARRGDAAPDQDRPARPGPVQGQRDRKSTRLNSSHLVISYAVFCLKKKKNITYKEC